MIPGWKRMLPVLLLCALLLSACGGGESRPEPRRIVIGTDLHYLAPSLTDHGEIFWRLMDNSDGRVTEYCDEITDAFLEQALTLRPQALILTGDLSFNGERESHLALAQKLAAVEEQGLPVLVLPGNHDVYRCQTYSYCGDAAAWTEGVDPAAFREIYAAFGYDEAISVDEDSLSYMAQLDEGSRVLMLDANTLHDPCGLSKTTLAWVEEQLAAARREGQFVLVACHQNLFRHSMFGAGYVLNRSGELRSLLAEYEVPLFLSGHLHIQHIHSEDGITEIAGSALTMGACQFGLLEREGETLRYEARPTDVAAWARAQGSEDENLLDFADYAAASMDRRTREQAESQLRGAGIPEEEIPELVDYACALNRGYFSGDLRSAAELDPDGALLVRWTESGGLFGAYFTSFAQEIGRDFRRWEGRES